MNRTKILVPLSIVALAVAVAASCGKQAAQQRPAAANVATTECGSHFDAPEQKDLGDEEAFVVTYSNGTVTVVHRNWVVPCDMHDVRVVVAVEGDVITVDEECDGGLVNCICSVDNRYEISPVEPGEYTLVFRSGTVEHHRGRYRF